MSLAAEFVLEARGLCKSFTRSGWWQKRPPYWALDKVSLALRREAALGLVGKSGCGKTTLAMCLSGLERPDSGEILLDGQRLSIDKPLAKATRKEIQLIFQDSSSSLNPRMCAKEIVEEPLLIAGKYTRKQRWDLAIAMLERVGLSSKSAHRLPSEFSGGERQRLAIARALILQPRVLILDEIFVGLDLSIQGQIANLLLELQRSQGLSYICISHNLEIVIRITDTIAVMEKGRIVEHTSPNDLLARVSNLAAEALNKPQRPLTLGASAAV